MDAEGAIEARGSDEGAGLATGDDGLVEDAIGPDEGREVEFGVAVADGGAATLEVAVEVGVAVGTAVAVGIGVGAGVQVGVGTGVGAGVGAGVGTGVGAGVGAGVGTGVGAGVGVGLTVNANVIVGKVPEPHDVEVDPPGLSAATPVQLIVPAAAAAPEIRKTALSPMGRPTSGFLSGGFLNVMIVRPDADPITTTHP
jgi:hypothetical protein